MSEMDLKTSSKVGKTRILIWTSTLAAVLLPLLLIAPQLALHTNRANAQSPTSLKARDEEVRQQMIIMSRQLGVTCTTCHKTDNFTADDLPAFKIAKEHIKLTQLLIDGGLDGSKKGKPKADCYLCHRGKLAPDFKENLDPLRKDPVRKKTESEIKDAKDEFKKDEKE